MDLHSRALVREDIPGITSWLGRLPLYERYGFTGEVARAALTSAVDGHDILLVGESPSGAIGLAWCLRTGAFGRSPYLKLLAVRDDAAGLGHGGRLLQQLEAVLAGASDAARRPSGVTDLFLLVADFNTAAQRFYERHGYSHVGSLDDFVLPGVSELLYRKSLFA